MKPLFPISIIFVLCGFSGLFAKSQEEQRKAVAIGPAQFYWLLNRACSIGDDIGARMLLDAGADADGESDYKELCKSGFGIEPSWPINLAAHGGHEEVLKLLIKRGARIDHPEGAGYTALIFAVSKGHESIVKLLLDAGADPNFKGVEGTTPIQIAQKKEHCKILKLLTSKCEKGSARQSTTRPESKSK